MNLRSLGSNETTFPQLGFGCGAVGGLIVRGDRDEARRAVERAIESGITYFDTAASYGDGLSEKNLGEILRELGAEDTERQTANHRPDPQRQARSANPVHRKTH